MGLCPVNERLARALASWRDWPIPLTAEPRVERELSAGRTNQNYLLNAAGTRLRLRLNADHARALGINRLHESVIVQALQPLHCTPQILHFDKAQNFAVLPFLEGRIWTGADLRRPEQLKRLRAQLSATLTVGISLPPRDYVRYLHNYQTQLEQRGAGLSARQQCELDGFIATWQATPQHWRPVLSHHDLIADNILETAQGLMILDWEYAAVGHPEIDERCILLGAQGIDEHFAQLRSGDCVDQLIFWMTLLWEKVDAQLRRVS